MKESAVKKRATAQLAMQNGMAHAITVAKPTMVPVAGTTTAPFSEISSLPSQETSGSISARLPVSSADLPSGEDVGPGPSERCFSFSSKKCCRALCDIFVFVFRNQTSQHPPTQRRVESGANFILLGTSTGLDLDPSLVGRRLAWDVYLFSVAGRLCVCL